MMKRSKKSFFTDHRNQHSRNCKTSWEIECYWTHNRTTYKNNSTAASNKQTSLSIPRKTEDCQEVVRRAITCPGILIPRIHSRRVSADGRWRRRHVLKRWFWSAIECKRSKFDRSWLLSRRRCWVHACAYLFFEMCGWGRPSHEKSSAWWARRRLNNFFTNACVSNIIHFMYLTYLFILLTNDVQLFNDHLNSFIFIMFSDFFNPKTKSLLPCYVSREQQSRMQTGKSYANLLNIAYNWFTLMNKLHYLCLIRY